MLCLLIQYSLLLLLWSSGREECRGRQLIDTNYRFSPVILDTLPLVCIAFSMPQILIKTAALPNDFPKIQHIRHQVFQLEQGVASELEFDGRDNAATHILAYLDQEAVGTARIRYLDRQTAKVERVAVLKEHRGQGLGNLIMAEVLAQLRAAQITEVRIHAQEAVRHFYLRLGFEPEGEVFEEAGILHVKMKKLLN